MKIRHHYVIDFLLSKGTQFWGIECKWYESISKNDFKSLKGMIETLGPGTCGVVFYNGKTLVPFSIL